MGDADDSWCVVSYAVAAGAYEVVVVWYCSYYYAEFIGVVGIWVEGVVSCDVGLCDAGEVCWYWTEDVYVWCVAGVVASDSDGAD